MQTYKSVVQNEESSAIDQHFMPEYKLYHMRHDLTWGAYFPGRLYLLVSFGFCIYSVSEALRDLKSIKTKSMDDCPQ